MKWWESSDCWCLVSSLQERPETTHLSRILAFLSADRNPIYVPVVFSMVVTKLRKIGTVCLGRYWLRNHYERDDAMFSALVTSERSYSRQNLTSLSRLLWAIPYLIAIHPRSENVVPSLSCKDR
jgi:hypothetical protein